MRSDAQPPPAKPLESQLHALPVVKSWSHIKVERGCSVWTETLSGIEIDDVADTVTTPVDHPIMSVKWGRISVDLSKILREVTRTNWKRLTLTAT